MTVPPLGTDSLVGRHHVSIIGYVLGLHAKPVILTIQGILVREFRVHEVAAGKHRNGEVVHISIPRGYLSFIALEARALWL